MWYHYKGRVNPNNDSFTFSEVGERNMIKLDRHLKKKKGEKVIEFSTSRMLSMPSKEEFIAKLKREAKFKRLNEKYEKNKSIV